LTRREVLLVTGSVLLALLVAEAAARLTLPRPHRAFGNPVRDVVVARHVADPELGWTLPAGDVTLHHRRVVPDGPVLFDIDYTIRDGHRATSPNLSLSSPAIAVTGCSFTFGFGLQDRDTWPWILQERLPDYRVVNLAVNGYGTDQALLAAEREVARPGSRVQAVVLAFGDFQIDRNSAFQFILMGAYPFSKPLFLPDGAGLRYTGQARFWTPGPLLEHSALLMHAANRFGNVYYHTPKRIVAVEITARLIEESGKRFREKNIPFAIVVLPHNSDRGDRARKDTEVIMDRLHGANIPVLAPDFPRRADGTLDSKRLLLNWDLHPNREYNTLLADQLATFLKSQHLIR